MNSFPESIESSSQATRGEKVSELSATTIALQEALQCENTQLISSKLEILAELSRDKSWKSSPRASLVQTWSVCLSVLDTMATPELYTQALQVLRNLSGFACFLCCPNHPMGPSSNTQWTTDFNIHTTTAKIAHLMNKFPDELNLQTAACTVFSRLTTCVTCQSMNSMSLTDVLLEAGALSALLRAIQRLVLRDSSEAVVASLVSSSSLSSKESLVVESVSDPAAILCIGEATSALRFLISIAANSRMWCEDDSKPTIAQLLHPQPSDSSDNDQQQQAIAICFNTIFSALRSCRRQWSIQYNGLMTLCELISSTKMSPSDESIMAVGSYAVDVATSMMSSIATAVQSSGDHQSNATQQRGLLEMSSAAMMCCATVFSAILKRTLYQSSVFGTQCTEFIQRVVEASCFYAKLGCAAASADCRRSIATNTVARNKDGGFCLWVAAIRCIQFAAQIPSTVLPCNELLVDALYLLGETSLYAPMESIDGMLAGSSDATIQETGYTVATVGNIALLTMWVLMKQSAVKKDILANVNTNNTTTSGGAAAAVFTPGSRAAIMLDNINTTMKLAVKDFKQSMKKWSMESKPSASTSTKESSGLSNDGALIPEVYINGIATLHTLAYMILHGSDITDIHSVDSTNDQDLYSASVIDTMMKMYPLSTAEILSSLTFCGRLMTAMQFMQRESNLIQLNVGTTRKISCVLTFPGLNDRKDYPFYIVLQRASTCLIHSLLHHPSGVDAINTSVDDQGRALVHIIAAEGYFPLLEMLLPHGYPHGQLDLLARTPHGATALQLAKDNNHTQCIDMLEEVTQRAAEARQEALLKELESNSTDVGGSVSGGDGSRKGKKKKSVTRSASFVAEQPDEKSMKMSSGDDGVVDMVGCGEEEEARRARKQQMEEEYERALEQRRLELAQQQQQDNADVSVTSSGVRPSTPAENSDNEHSNHNMQSSSGSDSDQGGSYHHVVPDHHHGSGSGSDDGVQQTPFMNAATSGMDPIISVSPKKRATDMLISSTSSLPTTATNQSSYYAEHSLFGSPSITADFFGGSDDQHHHGNDRSAVHRSYSTPVLQDAQLMNQQQQHRHHHDAAIHFQDALFVQHTPSDSQQQQQQHNNSNNTLSLQKEELLLNSLRHTLMHRETALSPPSPSPLSAVPSLIHPHHHHHHQSTTAAVQVVPQHTTMSPPKAPMAMSVGSDGSHSWMHPAPALHGSGDGSTVDDGIIVDDLDDSDESCEPTRHLWIGNLGTRTSRAILKTLFEQHGIVDDVVTFPGRMYAFVNYRTTEEAIAAFAAFQDRIIPELTGDRRLLLKYRPAKKATAHLRALGLVDEDGAAVILPGDAGSLLDDLDVDGVLGGGNGRLGDLDRDGNTSEPSPRIWLGNIAPTATSKSLHVVLGRFGPLTDAAVFPARIGPLGYAFVKFENLSDAIRAFEALNNTVVPTLSGSKQLKMRYKPATDGPGRDDGMEGSKASSVPSRHLWLGNVTQKPSEDIVLQIFARYGAVDSVRVFPAKAYAFVNFAEVSAAAAAVAELDGASLPVLTGVKPLVMRYQQEAMPMLPKGMMLPGSTNAMPRVHSESALALAASLNQLMPNAASLLDVNHPSAQLHRSPSVGFLGLNALGNQLPASTRDLHLQSSAFGGLNAQRQLDPLAAAAAAAAAAVSAQRDPSTSSANSSALTTPTTPMIGLPPGMNNSPAAVHALHGNGSIGSTSASATQLSAVLNNLTALQRAQSGSLPPSATATPTTSDIARLTSMLANQSITSATPSPTTTMPIGPTGNTTTATTSGGSSSSSSTSLLCPLSGQIMIDPVVAADGITYNRSAIMEWMSVNMISPVLQTPLSHATLIPNTVVRETVVGYLKSQLTAFVPA